jgi:hypothetical protein
MSDSHVKYSQKEVLAFVSKLLFSVMSAGAGFFEKKKFSNIFQQLVE